MKTLDQLGISPAPWKYIGYHYHKNGEYIHVGEVRAKCGKRKVVVDIAQPDARLIAAAPELYEALAALLNCAEKEAPFTTESGMSIAMDMARKAIAKAGGEK